MQTTLTPIPHIAEEATPIASRVPREIVDLLKEEQGKRKLSNSGVIAAILAEHFGYFYTPKPEGRRPYKRRK